jgi:hypothetical protein
MRSQAIETATATTITTSSSTSTKIIKSATKQL